MRRTIACVLSLSAAPVCAQATLVVDAAGGTGVHTTLQAAVQAAADGDIVLVRPTALYDFTLVTNKGLTVLGTGPARTEFHGHLQVVDLPAGRQFVARGIGEGPLFTTRMSLRQCAGLVVLEEVALGGDMAWGGAPALRIQDCAHVALRDITCCGQPGAAIARSTVTAASCIFRGLRGDCLLQGTAPGVAMTVDDSDVVTSLCALHGGDFWPTCGTPSTPAERACAALLLHQSSVRCGGGTLTGGNDHWLAAQVECAVIETGSQLLVDGATVLQPNVIGGPPVAVETGRVLFTLPPPGGIGHVDLDGPTGGLGLLALALPGPPLRLPFGTLWLHDTTLHTAAVGGFPLPVNVPVPAFVPRGTALAAQGLVLHQGTATLSAAAIATVR